MFFLVNMQTPIKAEKLTDQYSTGACQFLSNQNGVQNPLPESQQHQSQANVDSISLQPGQGGNEESDKPKVSENQIDFPSFKGVFGWTVLDNVNVPYIFRKDRKFVSVRIVEQKLLSRYPNSYPDELGKHQPLTSYFITEHEANLLNEINQIHCGGEFGTKQFNCKDLIVLLEDFSDFYNLVKKTFPVPDSPKLPTSVSPTGEEYEGCGWIQVNNTVTPYVWKNSDKFVPLSVMKYAANLSISDKGVLPTAEECDLLNKACVGAGFQFTFSKTTRLVSLMLVVSKFPVRILDLPSTNPLESAEFLEDNQAPPQHHQQPPYHQPNHIPPDFDPAQYGYIPQMSDKTLQQLPPEIRAKFMSSRIRGPAPGGQNMHPAFMDPRNVDPRMMFSYNKFPFGMYNMPYGPPNVTVNANTVPGACAEYAHLLSPHQQQFPRSAQPRQQRPQPSPNMPNPATSPHGQVSNVDPWQDMSNGQQSLSPTTQASLASSGQRSQEQTQQTQRMHQEKLQQQNIQQHHHNYIQNQRQLAVHRQQISPGSGSNTVQTHTDSQNTAPQPPHQAVTNGIPPPPLMSGPHMAGQLSNNQMKHAQQTVRQNHDQSTTPSIHNQNQPGVLSSNSSPPSAVCKSSNINPEAVINQLKNGIPTDQSVNYSESIKGVWLSGKSISCMHLESPLRKGRFCLVEAVCKLYFSGCSVNEFLYALENVLPVSLVNCTDDEEKAFIQYYSLPVRVLKCNKMIDFDDLEKYFPQLTYMFKGKHGDSERESPDQQSQTPAENFENTPTISKDSDTVTTDVNEYSEADSDRQLSTGTGLKRRSATSPNTGSAKQPCRGLEAIAQRLRDQHGASNTGMFYLPENQSRVLESARPHMQYIPFVFSSPSDCEGELLLSFFVRRPSLR